MTFRRKAGAQPGNKNAHKHGFYEGAMSKRAVKVLRRAAELDPHVLEAEIALLRSRMYELVQKQPDNITVLTLAARVLVKMVALDFGLGKGQESDINESLSGLLKDLLPRDV